jgi:dihydropteroate synthase
MALSNKTFVGETLDVGLQDRLTGTLAATAIAARDGAAVFRAHQVLPTRQTLEMAAAVNGTRPPARTGTWIA